MRGLAAIALLAALLPPAAGSAASPALTAWADGGGSAWRADACGCVDRAVWGGGGGAGWRIHARLTLEVEAEGFVVLVNGAFPGLRYGAGLRADLGGLGPVRTWARAGLHLVSVAGTRAGPDPALWLQPGASLPLGRGVLLDLWLSVERVFGPMARVELGLRQGFRFTFGG